MSVNWDSLKLRDGMVFMASHFNNLVDAVKESIDRLNVNIGNVVKYVDLSSLGYSIIPDQDNTRDLGSNSKQWRSIYAVNGYFSGNLLVQGKQVIKDGDPVNIGDIFDTARDKITQAINNAGFNALLTQRLDVALSQLARESTIQNVLSKLDVNLSTRASETTLQGIVSILNTILPTLSKESTLQDVKKTLTDINNIVSEIGSLVLLDYNTTPLTENSQWTSIVDDSPYTGLVTGYVISDVDGVLYIEQSGDGNNWDVVDTFNATSGQVVKFSVEKICRYIRVRYVNGSQAQSLFRIYVYRRLRTR